MTDTNRGVIATMEDAAMALGCATPTSYGDGDNLWAAAEKVAVLLSADAEYDDAFSAEYPKQTIIARRLAARARRAAAIRACRGEP